MTTARSKLVDLSRTHWYHCISKCVRLAYLMKQGSFDRKQWIENRLQKLATNFAIGVGGFSIMDNHLHVVVRLDPEQASRWSPQEVLRRWIAIYPPRTLATWDELTVQAWIEKHAMDAARVAVLRARLCNLGWFMKALKEPFARLANQEDGCTGTFWASRYKSIAILDEEALLITAAYVDLNPLAAGKATTPETSEHTSLRQRVAHVKSKGDIDLLSHAIKGSVAGSEAAGNADQDHWLIPLGTLRPSSATTNMKPREGMLNTFSLGSYVMLVDYAGRIFRKGKTSMSEGLESIFERLGIDHEAWTMQVKEMLKSTKLRGNSFSTRSPEFRVSQSCSC